MLCFKGVSVLEVHHKIIDFNRDARQAGTGDSENKEGPGIEVLELS